MNTSGRRLVISNLQFRSNLGNYVIVVAAYGYSVNSDLKYDVGNIAIVSLSNALLRWFLCRIC